MVLARIEQVLTMQRRFLLKGKISLDGSTSYRDLAYLVKSRDLSDEAQLTVAS
jgi:hypothetical protein